MDSLRQQLVQISARLDRLALAKRKGRKGRKGGSSSVTPGTTTAMATPMRGGRRRRRRGGRLNDGEIRMHRKELLLSVKVPAQKTQAMGHLDLLPGNFKFLSTLWHSFERIRYSRLNIYYRSAVGTTQGGMITYAIDWSLASQDKGRDDLSAYTPNLSHPVWETPRNPLVIPASRLQSRAWYIASGEIQEQGPARLLYAVDASGGQNGITVGEIWVDYDVVLSGTRS